MQPTERVVDRRPECDGRLAGIVVALEHVADRVLGEPGTGHRHRLSVGEAGRRRDRQRRFSHLGGGTGNRSCTQGDETSSHGQQQHADGHQLRNQPGAACQPRTSARHLHFFRHGVSSQEQWPSRAPQGVAQGRPTSTLKVDDSRVAFNSSPEVSFPKTKRGVCPGRGSRRHGPRAPVDPWSAW